MKEKEDSNKHVVRFCYTLNTYPFPFVCHKISKSGFILTVNVTVLITFSWLLMIANCDFKILNTKVFTELKFCIKIIIIIMQEWFSLFFKQTHAPHPVLQGFLQVLVSHFRNPGLSYSTLFPQKVTTADASVCLAHIFMLNVLPDETFQCSQGWDQV